MTDVDDVVTALAARITAGMAGLTIGGRTYAYAPDAVDPPVAVVLPSSGDFVAYDTAMDGKDDYELVVKLIVSAAYSRSAQAELLGYLSRTGTNSILTAIYADPTLGSVVSDLSIAGARGYGDVEWAGVVYYGAELVVTVFG